MQSTESLKNMNVLKTLTLGPDFRSSRGMYLRGKAVYKGTRHASKSGPTGVQMGISNDPSLNKYKVPVRKMGPTNTANYARGMGARPSNPSTMARALNPIARTARAAGNIVLPSSNTASLVAAAQRRLKKNGNNQRSLRAAGAERG